MDERLSHVVADFQEKLAKKEAEKAAKEREEEVSRANIPLPSLSVR